MVKGDNNEKLKAEYDATFEGVEQLEHNLLHIKSKITIQPKVIDTKSVMLSEFKKKGREDSIKGLTGVIKEWGVVSPIHVITLEDDDCYLLADGARRLYGALKGGLATIPAMVWNFSDKEEGKSMANVISLMVNMSQHFSPKEMWSQMQILEEVNGLNPGLIEFLLQMNAGESMKLKDIMYADLDYVEIRDALMCNELTIEAAYKKLCVQRKKENKLDKEDNTVIDGGVDAVSSVDGEGSEEAEVKQYLGDEEVKSLLEMGDENVDGLDVADMNKTDEIRGSDMHQTTDERHPVDKQIKEATLMRDDFKCRCCGTGGEQWLGVLVYHHLIPVFCGGPDTKENGLTLCANCHLTLHLYMFGKVQIDFEGLSVEEKEVFKNIFKFGNIALEAQKRKGIKKDDGYKADAGSRRHLFPGEGLKDNKAAFENAKTEE